MTRLRSFACTASAAVMMGAASFANSAPVSLELVLAIDVSGSVSASEFQLQRDGYATAFQSAGVQNAILASQGGSIAASFVQWSSSSQQVQSLGWTLIDSAAAANTFAASIGGLSRAFSGGTSVDAAITFSAGLFANNGYEGVRNVIDISGDGTSNVALTQAARDAAVAAGITINGLPIGGLAINNFYLNSVIGGPGAFIESVANFADFSGAVGRKLEREVIGVIPVPGALPLLLSGLLAVGFYARRPRKAV